MSDLPDCRWLTTRSSSGEIAPSDLAERVGRILRDGTPENTRRAYASDLRYASAWCRASGLPCDMPFAVETMVRFVVDHLEGLPPDVDASLVADGHKSVAGTHAISTISRRVASISKAHQVADLPNPCSDPRFREILSRSRKAAFRRGWTPRKRKAAHREALDAILATCGDDLRGRRDRALLLFAFSTGGRRRSEVAAATVERLERFGDDYVYHLGITKTSVLEEAGALPLKGVAARAMDAWLEASGIARGPIFRPVDRWGTVAPAAVSDEAVDRMVRARARLAGLGDAARFGGHSMRSGFMTEAGLRGVNILEAMELSRHRSVDTASGYYRAGSGLLNKAADLMG